MTGFGIITLTGPSCSGKTTLMNRVVKAAPDVFQVLRSYTSRPPRPGEQNGIEYDLVSEEEATGYILNDEAIQRVNFSGYEYGTHVRQLEELRAAGKIGITVVEPTGVDQFSKVSKREKVPYFSFFVNNHPEVLIHRWLDRVEQEIKEEDPETRAQVFAKTKARVLRTLREELSWESAAEYSMKIPRYSEDCRHSVEGVVLDTAMALAEGRALKSA